MRQSPFAVRDIQHLLLQPGLRDRLVESLDDVGVPAKARQAYVVSLTSRAPQTVTRWFDADRPGLPDLESLARLCEGLKRSSDWLLGLPQPVPARLAPHMRDAAVEVEWLDEVLREFKSGALSSHVLRMRGDEMVPAIQDGDLVFLERCERIAGNGIYALELAGRVVVRRVEVVLGSGFVLKCEQAGYQDLVLKNAAAIQRASLRFLGKVRGAVGLTRFRQQ